MKQEDSIVKIVRIEDKAASIGKCCMCTRQILNDPNEFWCAQTRMIGNKYYCGGCLLELAPIVKEVKEEYQVQKVDSYNEGTDKFYSIDQATGRMVITNEVMPNVTLDTLPEIIPSKALNKAIGFQLDLGEFI